MEVLQARSPSVMPTGALSTSSRVRTPSRALRATAAARSRLVRSYRAMDRSVLADAMALVRASQPSPGVTKQLAFAGKGAPQEGSSDHPHRGSLQSDQSVAVSVSRRPLRSRRRPQGMVDGVGTGAPDQPSGAFSLDAP